MLIRDSIQNEYLDNAHFDIRCAFSEARYSKLDAIVISSGSGLVPFTYTGGELKTPEFQLTCIVTPEQDTLLSELYRLTMHPGYVDETHPITVSWGYAANSMSTPSHSVACYLADYAPPSSVSYEGARILEVTLTLRPI